MKKMLMSCVLMMCFAFAQAQISLPESYYVNKAKAQLKAASDKKGREAVVVAVKDGCLHYVIRDGVKTDYFKVERNEIQVRIPYRLEPPQETKRRNPNDFAELLQVLYKEKFYLLAMQCTPAGVEIYFFEKQW